MEELAHANPFKLKEALGIIGWQLYATAWGIDRSKLQQPIQPKDSSVGNSQVLPRDYCQQLEIETVIKEIGEQVAARLRHRQKQTRCISLGIGFPMQQALRMDGAAFTWPKKLRLLTKILRLRMS